MPSRPSWTFDKSPRQARAVRRRGLNTPSLFFVPRGRFICSYLHGMLESGMAHSLARAIFHIVFSTKNREQRLRDPIRKKLFAYIAVVGRDMKCEVYRVGGMPDHIHVAIDLGRNISLAEFTKKIKQLSSLWLKQQSPDFQTFS